MNTPQLKKGTARSIYDYVPKRMINISSTCMLHKLCRREKAPMAYTHYSYFLTLTILVKYPFYSSSVRAISYCEHAGHVFHCIRSDFLPSTFCRIKFLGWIIFHFLSGTSAHVFACFGTWRTKCFLIASVLQGLITHGASCFTTTAWSCDAYEVY